MLSLDRRCSLSIRILLNVFRDSRIVPSSVVAPAFARYFASQTHSSASESPYTSNFNSYPSTPPRHPAHRSPRRLPDAPRVPGPPPHEASLSAIRRRAARDLLERSTAAHPAPSARPPPRGPHTPPGPAHAGRALSLAVASSEDAVRLMQRLRTEGFVSRIPDVVRGWPNSPLPRWMRSARSAGRIPPRPRSPFVRSFVRSYERTNNSSQLTAHSSVLRFRSTFCASTVSRSPRPRCRWACALSSISSARRGPLSSSARRSGRACPPLLRRSRWPSSRSVDSDASRRCSPCSTRRPSEKRIRCSVS